MVGDTLRLKGGWSASAVNSASRPVELLRQLLEAIALVTVVLVDETREDHHSHRAGARCLERPGRALDGAA